MGLLIRYATKASDVESGTVYECEKLESGPSTLLINITNQVYEYQYKREISHHNINGHQGNAMLQKVKKNLIFILNCVRYFFYLHPQERKTSFKIKCDRDTGYFESKVRSESEGE